MNLQQVDRIMFSLHSYRYGRCRDGINRQTTKRDFELLRCNRFVGASFLGSETSLQPKTSNKILPTKQNGMMHKHIMNDASPRLLVLLPV
jgi:hypothetical protein